MLNQEQSRNIFVDMIHGRRQKNRPGNTSQIESRPTTMPSDPISRWEATRGKRALLCGVTYSNQKYELKGTRDDVHRMQELLKERFDFPASSIRVLTEENENHHPTKINIQAALKWLVKDCQPGDSLVFYYSGHGVRQPDFDKDELDGFDETICPLDFMTAGMIIDNEINETIVRPLIPGVTLHAIIDSCHSGTVLDLPYVYKNNPLTMEGVWTDNKQPSGAYRGTNGGRAICLSACRDDQLAADTSAFSKQIQGGKKMVGAMTHTFINAVKQSPRITYGDILTSISEAIKEAGEVGCLIRRAIFHGKIKQDTMLSSSEQFDINTEFKL